MQLKSEVSVTFQFGALSKGKYNSALSTRLFHCVHTSLTVHAHQCLFDETGSPHVFYIHKSPPLCMYVLLSLLICRDFISSDTFVLKPTFSCIRVTRPAYLGFPYS